MRGFPNGFPTGGNNVDSFAYMADSFSFGLSFFLDGWLCLVEKPSKCLEQKAIHSSAKYDSAIEPSGRALLRTYDFNLPRYLHTCQNINSQVIVT